MGGPIAAVRHAGGVNWRGGKKKNDWRELPQRYPRYEIWPFSSRSPFLLKKKITKSSGERKRETQVHLERSPRRDYTAPFCWRISRYISGVCTVSLPPCVCVYKCLNECHKRGKDDKAKEGGMVDNSSSSKAQMVSRGPAWLPFTFLWSVSSSKPPERRSLTA